MILAWSIYGFGIAIWLAVIVGFVLGTLWHGRFVREIPHPPGHARTVRDGELLHSVRSRGAP